jgi:glycosyltransferase involved in cell wall biosynthesis
MLTSESCLPTKTPKFYSNYPQYASREIYDSFDHIVCVTEASAKSVKEIMGRDASSVHLIRNMLPASLIKKRAVEEVEKNERKKKTFLFVSIGRLSPEKAFDRIPTAARYLADYGLDFDWYIIGEGVSRKLIEDEIVEQNVSDYVHLLGTRTNPYPYINMSDCLVITSKYEAQPMVANEAFILDTPVVSTEFASVREVICDNINGIIVSQSSDAIASALHKYMNDEQCRETLKRGAKDFVYSNDREMNTINEMLSLI